MKTPHKDRNMKGIGGWLIIPIVGFFITIAICLLEILEYMLVYYLEDVIYYILADLGFIAVLVITLIMIFKKKKEAPKWAIASLILAGIINFLSGLYFALISTIIWVSYFLKSERVKNTMVN